MSMSDVLTLVLVIFAFLSYIDNHKLKRNSILLCPGGCYFFIVFN